MGSSFSKVSVKKAPEASQNGHAKSTITVDPPKQPNPEDVIKNDETMQPKPETAVPVGKLTEEVSIFYKMPSF